MVLAHCNLSCPRAGQFGSSPWEVVISLMPWKKKIQELPLVCPTAPKSSRLGVRKFVENKYQPHITKKLANWAMGKKWKMAIPDTFVGYAARLCKEWQSYARGCDPRSEPRRFAKCCKPFLILHPLLGIFFPRLNSGSEANARLPKPLHCAVTLKDRISSEFSDTFAATLGHPCHHCGG